MEKNKVKQIHDFGQSIWLDFIDRQIIKSGELQSLIDEDGVRGVTSNPAIFEKAITGSDDYKDEIRELLNHTDDMEVLFYQLAISDIRDAADLFKPVFNEEVKGADGFVSLEVSPRLALDTQGTIDQALKLWKEVDRENVMIKIPSTREGLEAIRYCIQEGVNINVTLLFSLERYRAVAEAYISGIEARVEKGLPVNHISSVASFFLSRIDVMIDPMLEEKGLAALQGEVAIASAKIAYQMYKEIFSGARWEKLRTAGAKPQRLLWASTSSKNPAFKATKYVDALIGPNTVDTVPLETIVVYRTEGNPSNSLEQGMDKAKQVLDQLKAAGIDLSEVTHRLEEEGIQKFINPYNKLIKAIEEQVKTV
ncbi:transaldolase [Pedobacter immunditicola]|uniref:transaldolase n=1 Tax=Pedobacter immunditicola TaxID=3133440 RepID=UPI0030A2F5E0